MDEDNVFIKTATTRGKDAEYDINEMNIQKVCIS